MISVRAIGRDERRAWARLGATDIEETTAELEAAGTSGPDRWLGAESDGVAVGSVGLLVEPAGGGSDRPEHRVFGLWLDETSSADRGNVAGALG